MKRSSKRNTLYSLLANPIGIGLFLLLLLLLTVFEPMSNDEGIWSYIGRIWSQNNIPPYSGAVENKTPAIFMLFAVSNIFCGVNIFFVRVIGVLSIVISSFTVYLIGRELHSRTSGVFSMIIFGLAMAWRLLSGASTSFPETFMVLFSSFSFYAIIKGKAYSQWKRWIIIAGLSMGMAIAFKQIALTTTLALIFFFLVYTGRDFSNKDRLAGLTLLAIGISISTIISLIPLLLSGASLGEYIDGAWLILLNSGSSPPVRDRCVDFFATWFDSRIVIFYPFLALIFLQKKLVRNRYFLGLLIWMFFDFLGVNASGYYWGHQIKQVIPSVSIVIGILLSNLLVSHISDSALRYKYIRNLAMILVILLFPYVTLISSLNEVVCKNSDINQEIGTWLKNNTDEKDFVYILGRYGSIILAYSERISSSKYINTTFVTRDDIRKSLLSDLKVKTPLYLLKSEVPINIGDEINDFIKSDYTFLYTKHNYEFFKRKLL